MFFRFFWTSILALALNFYSFFFKDEIFFMLNEIHMTFFKHVILCNSLLVMCIITSIYLYYAIAICFFADLLEYMLSIKKKYILGVVEIFFIAVLFLIIFKSELLTYFEYLEISDVLKKLNIFLIFFVNVSLIYVFSFFNLGKKESFIFFIFEFFIIFFLVSTLTYIKADINFILNPGIMLEHYLIFSILYLALNYLFLEILRTYFECKYPKVVFELYLRIVNLYILLIIINL